MTTTTNSSAQPANPPRHEGPPPERPEPGRQIPTPLVFLVGCVLLIGCALSISHLSDWADDHGSIPVFVAYFIIMSLAGRWFWTGTDAAITWATIKHDH